MRPAAMEGFNSCLASLYWCMILGYMQISFDSWPHRGLVGVPHRQSRASSPTLESRMVLTQLFLYMFFKQGLCKIFKRPFKGFWKVFIQGPLKGLWKAIERPLKGIFTSPLGDFKGLRKAFDRPLKEFPGSSNGLQRAFRGVLEGLKNI